MYKFKLFCIFKENSATFSLLKNYFHLSSNDNIHHHYRKIKGIIFEGLLPILEKENGSQLSLPGILRDGGAAIYGAALELTRLYN